MAAEVADRKLLTGRDVAERLNVSVRTVNRLVRQGKLTAIRFGKGRRYRNADVEQLLRFSEERKKGKSK